MFGFTCLLVTLIFIGAVLAHKLIFSFALSALSGVPRRMLHSRRRSRGTQMFRNMMRRKGTSYPGQGRDDGDKETQERVTDDTEEVPPEPPTDRDSVQRAGDDGGVEGNNVTYVREGDENPTPTEPPTFQARFRFTSSEREIDGDNIMSQNDGATNERAPSTGEELGQTAQRPSEEQAFGVRDKNESRGNQPSRIEHSLSSRDTRIEPGAQTPKEHGSSYRETTPKLNQDEKVPPHREETVSHHRENDGHGESRNPASPNETRGQPNVASSQPRPSMRHEKIPENPEEPEFNDERTPPPTDDS